MLPEDTKRKLTEIITSGIKSNHRRLIILENDAVRYLLDIMKLYNELRKDQYSVLFSGKEDREEAKWITPYVNFIKEREDKIRWGYVSLKSLERVMGTTWDVLIVDFMRDIRPNDLGRLIEVVKGGGLIIFLAPKREIWKNQIVRFHLDMITSPYTIEDLKPIFLKYLVSTMEISPGIWFISPDGKISGIPTSDIKPPTREKIIPENTKFPRLIYEMALTQDQIDVIRAIEERVKGGYVVITANRGRGKSVAIGLSLAGLVSLGGECKIILTAPEFENVKELINFFILSLTRLNIKPKYSRDKRHIKVNECEIQYLYPYQAWKAEADVIVVDEAAGVPVYLLERMLGRFKLHIFSSTLHGYEGAGRGFQVRFLPLVRKEARGLLSEVRMEEPIRYASNDPIENWLYDALLLDSDPVELSKEEIKLFDKRKLKYIDIDLEDWLLNRKDKLKEYIGIYVYAHYRNRPNDIMILCDAPHHSAAAILYEGKVVNSLHLCREGMMTREDIEATLAGEPPSGHLIPTVILRYYPTYRDVSNYRGIRIVRIATHPDLMNRGIGSRALKFIIDRAKELGMDWVGASFGVTEELLSFWGNNGFFPVHISPNKNPVSGEYSIVVIKPLTRRATDLFRQVRFEFKRYLLDSLIDPHFTLDPKVAYKLLSIDPWTINAKPKLTNTQKAKLKEYVIGAVNYAGAYDAIIPVVKCHFMRSPNKRADIPRKYEYMMIAKALQARSWDTVAEMANMEREDAMEKFREIIGRLRLRYVKE